MEDKLLRNYKSLGWFKSIYQNMLMKVNDFSYGKNHVI